jgi:heterotetrameric sarcosine oxidase gamma subunit
MVELAHQSPLGRDARQGVGAPGFTLREMPGVTKVRAQALRGHPGAAAGDPSRLLPAIPNTTLGDDPCVLWQAPGDWLACSQTLCAAQLGTMLLAARGAAPLVVTDVSSASVVLELTGARVLEVLARDCTLDLEGDAIPVAGCAQTVIAQVDVLIHRPPDREAWRLLVERSVAGHLWEWLTDSAGDCAILSPTV